MTVDTNTNTSNVTEQSMRKASLCSTLALAYLGDAVIELLVREMLVKNGISHPGELVKQSKAFITLEAQSDAVERILPHLTEEETAIFKRGRNAKTHFVPKHGEVVQYRRATALETVFGYLHLSGNEQRKRELFVIAFNIAE